MAGPSLDRPAAKQVVEKYNRILATRDDAAVATALSRLKAAAATDTENVMPLLVDCCHAYATVGEMVSCLKSVWGEFQEPVRL